MPIWWTIAWRVILKHKKRSLLTAFTIALGTGITVFFWALEEGAQDKMIANATGSFLGQIRFERPGFSDDYCVQKTLADTGKVFSALRQDSEFSGATARVLSQSMIKTPTTSRPVLLVGVDPEKEDQLFGLSARIVQGEFLRSEEQNGLLMGLELARALDAKPGDKLVVMAQDSAGNISGDALRVKGIFKLGVRELDNNLIIANAPRVQRLLMLHGYHRIVALIKHPRNASTVAARLNHDCQSWQDFMPGLVQGMAMDMGSIQIMTLIFLLLAGVAVANTVLMSVQQRIREFGLMISLGFKPVHVWLAVLSESLVLYLLGVVAGLVVGAIITVLVGLKGIDLAQMAHVAETVGLGTDMIIYPRIGPLFWSHIHEPLIGFLLASVAAAVWPAWMASRLEPSKTMRFT